MEKVTKITKLIFSVATLMFAIAAIVFVFKFSASDLHAVAGFPKALPISGQVFTQSKNGKTLYSWGWNRKNKMWQSMKYSKSWKN